MAAPDRPSNPSARAEDPLALRRFFDAVYTEVWDALGPYRLLDEDRRDVAQNVVFAAWRRRDSYREDLGTPRQWIRGIVRNEIRSFFRNRVQPLNVVSEDEARDVAGDAATPEEAVSMRRIADRFLAVLPIKERRAVVLHEEHGLTFREIAKVEGTSPTRAHARYEAGMKALGIAVEQWKDEQKQRGLLPLPFTVAALFATGCASRPPPEFVESAWQHACKELGLGDGLEGAPPDSSTRPCEPTRAQDAARPPSSHPRVRFSKGGLLRLLGLLGSPAGGGLIVALLMSQCDKDRDHDARSATALAPVPVMSASGPTPADSHAVTTAAASAPSAAEPNHEATPPVPAPTAVPPDSDNDRLLAEQALVDRARAALERGNTDAALAAATEHARQFPRGHHAAARERVLADACEAVRNARLADDVTKMDLRCAGRP